MSIFWRTMRQFALLATFSVVLFSGATAIAARPLPAFLGSLFLLLGVLVFTLAVALAHPRLVLLSLLGVSPRRPEPREPDPSHG